MHDYIYTGPSIVCMPIQLNPAYKNLDFKNLLG